MSMEKTLKEILDEILDEVEQELEEATTTAGVDGYNTPFAFGANRKKDKKKEKETATQAGYTIAESVNEGKVHFEKKLKSGNIFQVIDRDTKGMRGTQDKFSMQIVDKRGKVIKDLGSHPSLNGAKKFSNSVNEGKFKPSQVRSAISRVKKQLMRKWKQKGGYENFGQKELRQLQNKFDYNAYGDKDEREISHMLDAFDNWAMNYDGNMREDINEAKVKRPVNRWLELKNDDTMHPHKKMAMGLKELKYQLAETEKFFNWYNKIKTMNELDSTNYWKRTQNHIYKIKERLINIAKTIQEIEK